MLFDCRTQLFSRSSSFSADETAMRPGMSAQACTRLQAQLICVAHCEYQSARSVSSALQAIYSREEAHDMMVVDDPEFSPDPSASAAAPALQSFMAGLQAAARNSSMRPSWAINEKWEMVDGLQLFKD